MNKLRLGAAAAGLLAAAFLLAGCLPSAQISAESAAEDNTEQNLLTVGFSQLGAESLWRRANTASIQAALTRENGFYLHYSNARQQQSNQIKAIRSFISQQVDYIVFTPVKEEGWKTVLREAREAEIPVIILDRMADFADEADYTTFIGEDMYEEGEKAARWLSEYLARKGRSEEEINIVVLQGTKGSTSQLGRTIGFDRLAEHYKNWHILAQVDADFTKAKGKEVMQEFLKRYPELNVVICQNDDMMFGALEAMQEAGIRTGEDGDVILISFDGTKQALQLLQSGELNVDIECNPESGALVAEVLKKLSRGEAVEKCYYLSETVFTPENVDLYIDSRSY